MDPNYHSFSLTGKILLTSPIVINVPTRASLAVETKDLLFLWLAYLNNKSNVCKQISSLYSALDQIANYLLDMCLFCNTYPLDSDL